MPPTKRSFVDAVDNFTSTTHTQITPPIDPSLNTLPSPFVVCIFGASEGIGAGVAFAYAKAGASGIIISARSIEKLSHIASEIHRLNPVTKVLILPCDVTSSASVGSIIPTIHEEFDRLDCIVTGFGYSGPISLKMTDSKPGDIQRNFDVNCMGTYNIAHHLIPLLLTPQKPVSAKAFLAIGSVAGSILDGPIANFGYCTSKMAQARLIEFIAEQYRADSLLATSVHPGAVATPTALISTPEVFMPYLTDSANLAGGACVWLCKNRRQIPLSLEKPTTQQEAEDKTGGIGKGRESERNAEGEEDDRQWLSGRLISATWDFDELVEKKKGIVEGDLLTWRMAT